MRAREGHHRVHWRTITKKARLCPGWTSHVVAGGTPARFGRSGRRTIGTVTEGVAAVQLGEGRPVWLLFAFLVSNPSRWPAPESLSTTYGGTSLLARSLRNEPARCSASRSFGEQ